MRVFRHEDATGEIGACTVCVFTSMYWELRGEYDAFRWSLDIAGCREFEDQTLGRHVDSLMISRSSMLQHVVKLPSRT